MNEKIDIKHNDGSNIYFASDNHWGHQRILEFCKRPFKDVEEMNQKMIENWNNKVPTNGIVYHLGDFCWGGYPFWKKIREQLNGEIVLIKGNHCLKNLTPTAHNLFKHVAYQMRIEIEGRKIWLNHYPLLCYGGTYRDFNGLEWALSGHVHLSNIKERNTGLDYERCINNFFPTQYDVGVDFNDFTPISWNEVNEKIVEQVKSKNNLKMWIKNE
jgi:calcineurin-like phosphoesterase family protein